MIKHICCVRAGEEVMEIKQNLRKICIRADERKDKDLRSCALVTRTNDALAPESNYDFVLVCDFESIEKLNSYQVHRIMWLLVSSLHRLET